MPDPIQTTASRSLTARPTQGRIQADGRYVVKAGDSLYSIAERHLGSGARWPELMAANAALLKGSRVIMPGMALTLPARTAAAAPAPVAPAGDRLERSTPAPAAAPRQAAVPVPTPAPLRPSAVPVPTPAPARPALAPRAEVVAPRAVLVAPAPVAPKPPKPTPVVPPVAPGPVAPKPPVADNGKGDKDRDGIADRYDRNPNDRKVRGWNERASQDYAAFVQRHSRKLMDQGVEVDCADLAAKLLADFCKETGLPNPMAGVGKWHEYTPSRNGGLPNVNGLNLVLSQVGADNLAKRFTRSVNDANGNGVAGYNRQTGEVDLGDLRPGDVLFYDWDKDGVVNHTMNVVEVHADGGVTLAWGTYDNLEQDKPLSWGNLDLAPVAVMKIEVGTEEHAKFFGVGAAVWGVNRFSPFADQAKPFPIAS